MDFGTLLHVAKKNNESNKKDVKYYCTKFDPPKKESKDKKLSENIQKFLQKREEEEKAKRAEAKRNLDNLLASRDEKSKNKIKKMLKVTKSANKSVLDDAVNTHNTAVTLYGSEQPDQDDYGYVSNEANAFYEKYIEKVKNVKEDKPFAPTRPPKSKDLTNTKERVKAAITKEIEDSKSGSRQRNSTTTTATAPSSSSSSSTSTSGNNRINKETNCTIARAYKTSKTLYDPEAEKRDEERKKREEDQKRAKDRQKLMPPPIDFQALLKLAEQKQHEPVLLPVITKKENDRLLTSKEKKELEDRQRAKEEREKRDRERERERERLAESNLERKSDGNANNMTRTNATKPIPKLNSTKNSNTTAGITNKNSLKNSINSNVKKIGAVSSPLLATVNKKPSLNSNNNAAAAAVSSKPTNNKPTKNIPTKSKIANSKPTSSKPTATSDKLSHSSANSGNVRAQQPIKTREFPPRDIKTTKSRPSDNHRETKKPQAMKRRILDDDEDEFDSELDDFIDDGDEDEDYSSHIKAIFGYDKSKYRDVDEDVGNMEASFAQMQREEYISKKIGLQEDLEDMRLEAMEKKRKIQIKKRRLH